VPAILLLTLAVLWIYRQVGSFGFVWDDASYIVSNPIVSGGLNLEALGRSFGFSLSNWHPLAWISHMLDVQLFGMDPGWHHRISVAVHLLCAVALLFFLKALTGSLGAAALATAVFAMHPLRVESVAWVTERKDALSTLLFLLAAGRWIRHPPCGTWATPLATGGLFTLALMTKPMAVTLPLVLLIFDWWPLGRVGAALGRERGTSLATLVREKSLLWLLAIAAGVATLLAQSRSGAVLTLAEFPFTARLAQVPVSAVRYLLLNLWPVGLSVLYPLEAAPPPAWQVLGSALLLAVLTAAALRVRRRQPWVGVGWGWFLITLLPVIGILQTGKQAIADRFTYLPSVGLSLILAGTVADAARFNRWYARPLALAALILSVAFAVQARVQTAFWRDNLTLYERALAVTTGNWLMLNNHGFELERRGDLPGAERDYRKALRLRPELEDVRANLARVQELLAGAPAAAGTLREGLVLQPRSVAARILLAELLLREGQREEAALLLEEALLLERESAHVRLKLAVLYGQAGRAAEAEKLLREILHETPDTPVVAMNLAIVVAQQGRAEEAFALFREAVRRTPQEAEVHYNFGLALEGAGHLAGARDELRTTLRLQPGHALARARLRALDAMGHAIVPPR